VFAFGISLALAATSASGQATPPMRSGTMAVERAIESITQHQDARPYGNGAAALQGLFRGEDYPPQALARGEEGSVGVLVSVDKRGAVKDCVVVRSSGYASLDTQTCRIIWMRAKFNPPRSATAKAANYSVYQTITWRLEDDPAPSDPWRMRLTISFDGKPPSCKLDYSGPDQFRPPEATICQSAGITRAWAELVRPGLVMISENEFTIGEAPPLIMMAGDHLLGRQVVRMEVDAAGFRSSCAVIRSTGSVPPEQPGPCNAAPRRFVPRKDASGAPAGFTAYMVFESYLRIDKPSEPQPGATRRRTKEPNS
jgi:TonB family protein